MENRILGIDLARALALMGMIIVNFKIFFGESGNQLLVYLASTIEGKASATFVFLAGTTMALMSNNAIRQNNQEKISFIKIKIFKRAMFLFVFGLLFVPIWDADILHFYGIYMMISIYFITKKTSGIFFGVYCFMVIYLILFFIFDYDKGWNFELLEYSGFWTVGGFIKNLFFNGFHPVFAWVVFMLVGLWFGKQNINDTRFLKKVFFISLCFFIFIHISSKLLISFIGNGDAVLIEELNYLIGTQAMPPLIIYLLNGIFISLVIVSASILFVKKFTQSKIILALNKMGQLTLSLYIFHIILGIIPFILIDENVMGSFCIEFSLIYSFVFIVFCILFANIWLKYNTYGPFEALMRKISK